MPRQHSRRWMNRVARERKNLERNPELAICWLCGEPINMALPYLHQRSFTLDHVVPVARGGDQHSETRPAHRDCNSSRGKGRDVANRETLLDW